MRAAINAKFTSDKENNLAECVSFQIINVAYNPKIEKSLIETQVE